MLDSKGFTLVELLVTIAIVAVLIGIALPLYTDTASRAEYSELVANIRVYEASAQTAIASNGFPTETIVWGDGEQEADEWSENKWVVQGIDTGILVTINVNGKCSISFEEDSEIYDRYIYLIDKYGELEEVV